MHSLVGIATMTPQQSKPLVIQPYKLMQKFNGGKNLYQQDFLCMFKFPNVAFFILFIACTISDIPVCANLKVYSVTASAKYRVP